MSLKKDIENLIEDLRKDESSKHNGELNSILIKRARSIFDNSVFLPQKDQTAAIAWGREKTAALFYDRIYDLTRITVPEDIRIAGDSNEEKGAFTLWVLESACNYETLCPTEDLAHITFSDTEAENKSEKPLIRHLAKAITNKYRYRVVPIYTSIFSRDRKYQQGKDNLIVFIITDIPIVDEYELSWEQVNEFRNDSEAMLDYRRFICSIDSCSLMIKSSVIGDDIFVKLTKYENALSKHGIKTRLGTIELTFHHTYFSSIDSNFIPYEQYICRKSQETLMRISNSFLSLDNNEWDSNSEIMCVYETNTEHRK